MMKDGTIKIVELNPFSRSTGTQSLNKTPYYSIHTVGSCLFDWIIDKELIEKGPFQFRVIEQPNQKRAASYLLPWKHLLHRAVKDLECAATPSQNGGCVLS